jgi:protein ImuA
MEMLYKCTVFADSHPHPMPAAHPSASRRISAETLAALRGAPLWQADQLGVSTLPACPTGHAALDAELPGGGWPAGGLTELLLDEPGCGEIRLLAPALARWAEAGQRRELAWIAPPHPPYAPALRALGLPLERLVWVDAATEADAAWAAEQVLRCGAGAVLWWSCRALPATLRRLHLAAMDSGTPLFAMRPLAHRAQSSPAPLRLAMQAAGARLSIDVFKRRGPALARPLSLKLASPGRPRRKSTPPVPQVADVVAGPAPALAAA